MLDLMNKQPFYDHLIQDNPGEPMLSQSTDLLEQNHKKMLHLRQQHFHSTLPADFVQTRSVYEATS